MSEPATFVSGVTCTWCLHTRPRLATFHIAMATPRTIPIRLCWPCVSQLVEMFLDAPPPPHEDVR